MAHDIASLDASLDGGFGQPVSFVVQTTGGSVNAIEVQ